MDQYHSSHTDQLRAEVQALAEAGDAAWHRVFYGYEPGDPAASPAIREAEGIQALYSDLADRLELFNHGNPGCLLN